MALVSNPWWHCVILHYIDVTAHHCITALHSIVFEINIHVIFVCAGTAQRNRWSCRRMSAMSWWKKRAAVCSRLDTGSATHRARRKPSRSTWTEALPRTRGRTEAENTTRGYLDRLAAAAQQPGYGTLSLSVGPDSYLNIKQHSETNMLSPSTLSPRTGSANLLCTIVYCTVKFKGKYESYSIQTTTTTKKKKNQILYRQINVKAPEMEAEMLGLWT